jgi:hypothetical protein
MTEMAGASGPGRIDVEIVNVLLRVADNPLEVFIGPIDIPSQPVCVLDDQLVVFNAKCGVQVAKKQADNSFLVGIRDRHVVPPSG